MTFSTVTLTGTYLKLDGSAQTGTVTIRATTLHVIDDAGDQIFTSPVVVPLNKDGHFSVAIPATDDPNLEPEGWGYTVTVALGNGTKWSGSFELPAANPVVDITDITVADPGSFIPNLDFVTQVEFDSLDDRVSILEEIPVDEARIAAVEDGVIGVESRVTTLETDSATRVELGLLQDEVDDLGETVTSLASGALSGAKLPPTWGIYAYGNSYGVYPAGWFTLGKHYLHQLRDKLAADSLSSYAVGAERTLHCLYSLIQGVGMPTAGPIVSGSKMPTDNSRKGLVVLDTLANDIGNYPSMSGSPVVPAKISNTNYVPSHAGMYRLALALASGGGRVEASTGTFTGTWVGTNIPAAPASSGSFAQTKQVGAAVEFSIKPPQQGSLAGRVYLAAIQFGVVINGNVKVYVDGVEKETLNMGLWTPYTGVSGGNVEWTWVGREIRIPVDGEAHSVRFENAAVPAWGGDNYFSPDFIVVPSEDPNIVVLPGMERIPIPTPGVFTQAGVEAWAHNAPLINDAAKAVCDEFPNAVYVPSTMSGNGLYSGDGLHPNDRGMEQRANDILKAVEQSAGAYFQSKTLELAPDSNFQRV